MEVRDAIRLRHSYRGEFADRPVSRETLIRIIRAAIDAPSGKNRQTPVFVIVDEPELTRALLARIGNGPHLRTAKAAIVVVMTREETGDSMDFGIQDYAAAIENMLLVVTDLGLATVWIEGELLHGAAGDIARMVDVPGPHEVRVVLPIGYPAKEAPRRTKKPLSERAWFNAFGSENE